MVLATLGSAGQSKRIISAVSSYQFFNRESIGLGLESSLYQRWDSLNFKHQLQVSLQGQMFLDQPGNEERYYGLITDFHFCTKFVALGGQFRTIFQDNRQRYEIGPSLKLGYKYLWIAYFWSGWNFANNPFKHHRNELPIEFKNGEHNVRLVLSIPIIKCKRQIKQRS